jgi:hypothetical protein
MSRVGRAGPEHLAQRRSSFRGELQRLRIEYAEAALTRTDLPVEEIARRLGYSEQSALARAVRRQLGAAPSQLRARLQGARSFIAGLKSKKLNGRSTMPFQCADMIGQSSFDLSGQSQAARSAMKARRPVGPRRPLQTRHRRAAVGDRRSRASWRSAAAGARLCRSERSVSRHDSTWSPLGTFLRFAGPRGTLQARR